jgi:hypothetical protein
MKGILSGDRGICPYCQTVVQFINPSEGNEFVQYRVNTLYFRTAFVQCPSCQEPIISLIELHPNELIDFLKHGDMIWPKTWNRAPAPQEVPVNIAKDYNEASAILDVSPTASAALSRRCLQTILTNAANTKSKELSKQINEVIGSLPGYIANNLDAIRNIGNFAAHEQKSTNSGEILDVEPGEAEWNLEVLDSLFDFYYVRPKIEAQKRLELDKKLADAGKPPLKQP